MKLRSRIIAVWAITYGALITSQGNPAWGTIAYDILQNIPGAPQTIGIVLIICGAGLFFFEGYRPLYAGIFCAFIGLCTFAIGAGFALADAFVDGVSPIGQPGAITYILFFTPIIALRSYSLIVDRV